LKKKSPCVPRVGRCQAMTRKMGRGKFGDWPKLDKKKRTTTKERGKRDRLG